jgi:hypothetical protein
MTTPNPQYLQTLVALKERGADFLATQEDRMWHFAPKAHFEALAADGFITRELKEKPSEGRVWYAKLTAKGLTAIRDSGVTVKPSLHDLIRTQGIALTTSSQSHVSDVASVFTRAKQ